MFRFSADRSDEPSSLPPHIAIARKLVGRKFQNYLSAIHPEEPKTTWAGAFSILETRAVVTSLLEDCDYPTSGLDRLQEQLDRLQDDAKETENDGYVSPFVAEKIEEILEKIGNIPTGVVFKGKTVIEVTPESYLEACELLMIEPGSTYEQGHKAYIRKLATCHPDKIERLALETMPERLHRHAFMYRSLMSLKDKQEEEWIFKTKRALDADPLIPGSEMEEFTRRSREFGTKHAAMIRYKIDNAVQWAMYRFEGDTPESDAHQQYKAFLQEIRDSFCRKHFGTDFCGVLLEKFSYTGESQDVCDISKELPENLKKGFDLFLNDLRDYEREEFKSTPFAKMAITSELSRYGITLPDLETAESRYEERVAHWERVYSDQCRDIGETLSNNRDAILHAWEVFQAYQWVAWEDAKGNIDIIWGFGKWGDGEYEYKKIDLDRTDVIVAGGFRRSVCHWGGLWYHNDHDWRRGTVWKKDSVFAMVVHGMDEADWPEGLRSLIALLESPKLDEGKVRAQTKILREGSFRKPETFDKLMASIEEHPSIYSDAKEDILFEPTLLFGEWGTWTYALHEQCYELPLWLIFSHLYLHTAGKIPLRLGEKFLRKYLPDITVHEMGKILERISKRDDPEEFFAEEVESLQEEQRIIYDTCWKNGWNFFRPTEYGQMAVVSDVFEEQRKIENEMQNNSSGVIGPEEEVKQLQDRYEACENRINSILRLQQTVRTIYAWPEVEKVDDFHGEVYGLTRVGLEVTPEGGITLYFPLNDKDDGERIDTIHFSPKEAITMYLATLECPILDSRASMTRLLANGPAEDLG